MLETSKAHERYLAGALIHSLDLNPTGDYSAVEILARVKHNDILNLGAKAVLPVKSFLVRV